MKNNLLIHHILFIKLWALLVHNLRLKGFSILVGITQVWNVIGLGLKIWYFGFNYEETTRDDLRFGFTNGPQSIEQYLDTKENNVSKNETSLQISIYWRRLTICGVEGYNFRQIQLIMWRITREVLYRFILFMCFCDCWL
jgi:hypothetical protein